MSLAITYRIRCDSCPAQSPPAKSAGDARRRALRAGYRRTLAGPSSPARDECPKCASGGAAA